MSNELSRQALAHLHLLQVYIQALESGDLERLSDVLHQAERDPVLTRLLLVVNTTVQSKEGIGLSAEQVLAAWHVIATTWPRHRPGKPSMDALSSPPGHFQEQSKLLEPSEKDREPPMNPFPSGPEPPLSLKGRRWQLVAAVLGICLLLGSFLFTFSQLGLLSRTGFHPSRSPVSPPTGVLAVLSEEAGTNRLVIVGRSTGTGAVLWTFQTHQHVPSGGLPGAQMLVQDRVLYAVIMLQVVALDLHTGTLLWQQDLSVSVPMVKESDLVSLQWDQGFLYVRLDSLGTDPLGINVYALRATTGTLVWSYAFAPNNIGANQRTSLLVVSNGIVYVGDGTESGTGMVQALRGNDGLALWSYPTEVLSLAVAKQTLYVFSASPNAAFPERTLLALDSATGRLLWKAAPMKDATISPVLVEATQIMIQVNNQLCVFSAQSGHLQTCVGGDMSRTSNYTLAGDLVLFTTGKGGGPAGPDLLVQARRMHDASVAWSQTIPAEANEVPNEMPSLAVLQGTMYVPTVWRNKHTTTLDGSSLTAFQVSDGHREWSIMTPSETLIMLVVEGA